MWWDSEFSLHTKFHADGWKSSYKWWTTFKKVTTAILNLLLFYLDSGYMIYFQLQLTTFLQNFMNLFRRQLICYALC